MTAEQKIEAIRKFLDDCHTIMNDLSYCIGGKTFPTVNEYRAAYSQYKYMRDEIEKITDEPLPNTVGSHHDG